MPAAWIANLLLVLHALFIVWVVAGGLVVWRWPRLAWLHLPALAWGVWIEATGGVCPLTPLESRWRDAAGQAGYAGGFIEHWLDALIYPAGLTRAAQLAMGSVLLSINVAIYLALIVRRRRRR